LLLDQFTNIYRIGLQGSYRPADRGHPIIVEGILSILRWGDGHQRGVPEPIIIERPG